MAKAGKAGRVGTKASKVIRIVRLVRMVRVVKLYKMHNGADDAMQDTSLEPSSVGKKLTEIINTTHENVKYLPGAKLPPNVVANPSLASAASGATMEADGWGSEA